MINLLGTRDILALCEELGIKPSKKRGQNFVTDPGTVRRIAGAGWEGSDVPQTVLEIGPGLGSLTLALLERGVRVVAVEIDRLLAAALPETIRAHGAVPEHLRVVQQDAMNIRSGAELVAGTEWEEPSLLVANLPYNVATPLLLHALEVLPSLRRAVVMVQAEVADRWVAGAGEIAYGAPSVKLAWWGTARRIFAVGRSVFYPAPNVDSAVVEFRRKPIEPNEFLRGNRELISGNADLEQLRMRTFEVVNAAFGQRRKTLRQSLATLAGSPILAEKWLEMAGIDPRLRAEKLTVADFARLGAVKEFGMNDTI